MAGETTITIIGNLTADPELRFTASGAAVASFTIASTPRTYDRNSGQWKDGEALFMRCSAWREMAENITETCTKGMRVMAQGRLQQRSYETQQGEKRTVVEMQVDEIGPSLRYASAQVKRNPREGGGYGGSAGNASRGGFGNGPAGNAGANPNYGGGQGGFGNQESPVNRGGFGGDDDPWGSRVPENEPSQLDQDPPF